MMEVSIDDTTVLATYEFYIYANLRLFQQIEVYSNQITIVVECGNEVITQSLIELPEFVYWRNDGNKVINF